MGYYVIYILTKERINNMSKETMKQTINTIKSLDGMKAVKVAFDLSQTNMDSITKVTEVVTMLDDNLKSLAIKVMELEKTLESVMDQLERVVKKQVEDYERSQN